jgi:hypothetical protein
MKNEKVDVAVGTGATYIVGSDSYAATVIEVRTPKLIVIQFDKATRTDSNGLSEQQEYSFQLDPTGQKEVVSLRRDGRWRVKLTNILVEVGKRYHYSDPNF